jgi:nitrite reductase/ring-hydroxylating ferredoxin subunit
LYLLGLGTVCLAAACGDGDERLDAGRVEDFEVGLPMHFESDNVYVVALRDGSFKAFFDRDPRTGCILQFPGYGNPSAGRAELRQYGSFREGCHGSAYDIEGQRTFGPSGFDLTEYPVQVREGSVIVSLDSPQCWVGGAEDAPTTGCVLDVPDNAPIARTPADS